MKATKAQKAAHVIAAEFTQWTVDREAVEKRIAEAIEKAAKAERRACVRVAKDHAAWIRAHGLAPRESIAIARDIRARSRS